MKFEIIPTEKLPGLYFEFEAVDELPEKLSEPKVIYRTKKRKYNTSGMICYSCHAGIRKPYYTLKTYPSGHMEQVPQCKKCFNRCVDVDEIR